MRPRHVLAVGRRVLLQIRRDPRFMGLSLLAPCAIVVLLKLVLDAWPALDQVGVDAAANALPAGAFVSRSRLVGDVGASSGGIQPVTLEVPVTASSRTSRARSGASRTAAAPNVPSGSHSTNRQVATRAHGSGFA